MLGNEKPTARGDAPADEQVTCRWSSGDKKCGKSAECTQFAQRFDGELHPARVCLAHAWESDGRPVVNVLLTTNLNEAMAMAYGCKDTPAGMVLEKGEPTAAQPRKKHHMKAPRRLYIFDADGTLRRCTVPNQPCPNARDQWELIPGVHERLAQIDWEANDFAIASNQGGVALGYIDPTTAFELLVELAVAATGRLPEPGRVYICPHRPGSACLCRKPEPAMLLWSMRATATPHQNAVFIGDRPEDRSAASRAGIRFIWANDFFRIGHSFEHRLVPSPDHISPYEREVLAYLRRRNSPAVDAWHGIAMATDIPMDLALESCRALAERGLVELSGDHGQLVRLVEASASATEPASMSIEGTLAEPMTAGEIVGQLHETFGDRIVTAPKDS